MSFQSRPAQDRSRNISKIISDGTPDTNAKTDAAKR